MPHTRTRLKTRREDGGRAGHADGPVLEEALDAVRRELELPDGFDADVLAEAERSATSPQVPDHDWTDVELVTVDPPGATDLDQAMHLERRGSGYRVRYAIADVAAFVAPGGLVDAEARRRGQTLYAPDSRVPLHPPVLSEDAASLLPGVDRPAYVWVVDLDDDGETTAVDVVRALVRSRAQLTYAGVQADVEAGRVPEPLALLAEIGRKRVALEHARGGASLAIPDQEVVETAAGYELRFRPPVPVEDWNAQVSLLTGMAAANLMLAGEVGVLRTMPGPDPRTIARFHRQAGALGAHWPAETPYGDFLRSLDPTQPRQLALLHASATLFRGAGYTPFDGAVPEQVLQAAVGAPYAHVTAPLRRLVDRFTLVVCESLCRGRDIPDWVRSALPELPGLMADSDRRAGALERASLDAAEAVVLADQVGERFEAVVVDVADDGGSGLVQLLDPAVLARAEGRLELGSAVTVVLEAVDPVARTVRFVPAA
jgi:exoribonuclease R